MLDESAILQLALVSRLSCIIQTIVTERVVISTEPPFPIDFHLHPMPKLAWSIAVLR